MFATGCKWSDSEPGFVCLTFSQVHGLLHVLDYDHELGPSASQEMEEEENRILNSLGWKGKGLIYAATIEDGLSFKDSKTGNGNLSMSVESGKSFTEAMLSEEKNHHPYVMAVTVDLVLALKHRIV